MDEGTCFVGIDESNHGRYPEIFVGVFSNDPRDIQYSSFSKQRRKNYNPFAELDNRIYCFSLLRKKDKLRILNKADKDLEGLATSSLIHPFSKSNPGLNYEIYWDGEKEPGAPDHIKEMVCNNCEIESKNISIKSGKKLDTSLYIVNLADSIAYQLFIKRSLRKNNKNKMPFIY